MKIKPTPIIKINTTKTLQTFNKTRPKKPNPNDGLCPHCKGNIRQQYGYVFYSQMREEYGTYSDRQFDYDDSEPSGTPEFSCPMCGHTLTGEQARRLVG